MQQPLNAGRQYITPKTPNWRDLESCAEYQYIFTTSRKLHENERAELIKRLGETVRNFCTEHARLFGATLVTIDV